MPKFQVHLEHNERPYMPRLPIPDIKRTSLHIEENNTNGFQWYRDVFGNTFIICDNQPSDWPMYGISFKQVYDS